jgi:endonuclease YncB( thermonuclease family)
VQKMWRVTDRRRTPQTIGTSERTGYLMEPNQKQIIVRAANIFTAVVLVVVTTAHACALEGRVVGVADGDTITVLDNGNQQHKIRLASIDAPERGQPFGNKAKRALSSLVAGKMVRVETTGKDRYDRTIGTVYIGNGNVNRTMVYKGFAWNFVKYSTDPKLAEFERQARSAKRGLWSGSETPVPPWEYRNPGPRPRTVGEQQPELTHWLNTGSGVRHSPTCKWFGATKRGRYCRADEGRPCGTCGG